MACLEGPHREEEAECRQREAGRGPCAFIRVCGWRDVGFPGCGWTGRFKLRLWVLVSPMGLSSKGHIGRRGWGGGC